MHGGGIAATGERARNFVLGLRAPLLQSLSPFASPYTLGLFMAICWEKLAAAANSLYSLYSPELLPYVGLDRVPHLLIKIFLIYVYL